MDFDQYQQEVYDAVAARGYTEGWTDGQFVARQLCKLTEELDEATLHIHLPDSRLSWGRWLFHLSNAGISARDEFDNKDRWNDAWISDLEALRSELADLQVVLFCAAEALARATGEPFDVVQKAKEKALADVERGVRC